MDDSNRGSYPPTAQSCSTGRVTPSAATAYRNSGTAVPQVYAGMQSQIQEILFDSARQTAARVAAVAQKREELVREQALLYESRGSAPARSGSIADAATIAWNKGFFDPAQLEGVQKQLGWPVWPRKGGRKNAAAAADGLDYGHIFRHAIRIKRTSHYDHGGASASEAGTQLKKQLTYESTTGKKIDTRRLLAITSRVAEQLKVAHSAQGNAPPVRSAPSPKRQTPSPMKTRDIGDLVGAPAQTMITESPTRSAITLASTAPEAHQLRGAELSRTLADLTADLEKACIISQRRRGPASPSRSQSEFSAGLISPTTPSNRR